VRRVLGDVGRRAAVLATEGQALEQAQADEDDRRRDPDRCVGGQEADDERRHAHDHDRDQEGVLAADHVAQAAEDERAEGTDQEAGREGHQRGDERRRRVEAREELLGDDRRERAVEIEVVPLEDRSETGSEDDFPLFLRHRPSDVCAYRHRCCDHVRSLPCLETNRLGRRQVEY
jgi:hypothetical protein